MESLQERQHHVMDMGRKHATPWMYNHAMHAFRNGTWNTNDRQWGRQLWTVRFNTWDGHLWIWKSTSIHWDREIRTSRSKICAVTPADGNEVQRCAVGTRIAKTLWSDDVEQQFEDFTFEVVFKKFTARNDRPFRELVIRYRAKSEPSLDRRHQ